jgi:hypothetical protein
MVYPVVIHIACGGTEPGTFSMEAAAVRLISENSIEEINRVILPVLREHATDLDPERIRVAEKADLPYGGEGIVEVIGMYPVYYQNEDRESIVAELRVMEAVEISE